MFTNQRLPATGGRFRGGRAFLSLTAALLCSVCLLAQAPPPSSESRPVVSDKSSVVHVNTRLVVIDIVVTDKRGRPVAGLKKEDFALKEDGKNQIIKSFEAHVLSAQRQTPPKLNLPPDTYTNLPVQPPQSAINIVLFDLMNTPIADQMRAREEMLQFLKTLPSGQQVALFALGSRLQMLSGFTTDSDQLIASANRVVPHSSALLTTETDRQHEDDHIADLARGSPSGASFQPMRDFLDAQEEVRTTMRVEATLSTLNALARGVSGYSGRKNLLWLSEGFPFDFGPNTDAVNPFLKSSNYAALLQETSALLASAQMAVYPIDIGGLRTVGVSAENSGRGAIGLRNGQPLFGSVFSSVIRRQLQDINAIHATMEELAKNTGGKAFCDTNDLKSAMASSLERGTNYYSLAYTPENKTWDSKYRRVEVELDQSGLKTDYRKGYFAIPNPDPASENDSARRLLAAMQPGMPDATMVSFAAQVPPLKLSEQTATLNYIVNAQQIAFTKTADQRQRAKIEMVAVAWDSVGKLAASASQDLDLALKPETYESVFQDGIRAQMKLQLKPGKYQLRLGVMDDSTGKIGTIEFPYQVAESVSSTK